MLPLLRYLLAAVLLVGLSLPAAAKTLIGTCIAVADGDTITVRLDDGQKEKVRLLGIDAPEVAHGRDPGQEPWGSRAAAFTRKLCLNQTVRIETDVQPRDRYRRLLGYVYVDKTFVNLELVKAGHAMLLTYPPNVRHVDSFVAAQREAQAAGRGIWNINDRLPQTPRDYRRQDKRQVAPSAKAPPAKAPAGTADPRPVPVGVGAAVATDVVLYNPKSRIYHRPGCRHATSPRLQEVPRSDVQGRPCRACHG